MKITVRLMGGLGNQMFEYACARNIQLKYQAKLFLDCSHFLHEERRFSLNNLNIPKSVIIVQENMWMLTEKLFAKILENTTWEIGQLFGHYVWLGNNGKDIPRDLSRHYSIVLFGYWQGEKYFIEHKDEICSELRVKQAVKESNYFLYHKIIENNSVCVHVRRSDYITSNLIVCTKKYYENGMSYINNAITCARFFIFTDDVEWTRRNIVLLKNAEIIGDVGADYEVLQLMYSCSHFVMSNSSFSWWAYYLSMNEKKIAIAPERWFNGKRTNDAIYCNGWICMNGDGKIIN